jgi:hypothetical protein
MPMDMGSRGVGGIPGSQRFDFDGQGRSEFTPAEGRPGSGHQNTGREHLRLGWRVFVVGQSRMGWWTSGRFDGSKGGLGG